MSYLSTNPDLAHQDRLTATDVATILGVTPQTVQRSARRGRLPKPAQTQPFLAWDAATFWGGMDPRDTTPVPLAHWAPAATRPTPVIAAEEDYVRVEYLTNIAAPLAVIYTNRTHPTAAARGYGGRRFGASPWSTIAIVGHLDAGTNRHASVSPTGLTVQVYPPSPDAPHGDADLTLAESYTTSTAAIAHAVGGPLPFFLGGYDPTVGHPGYKEPPLMMLPWQRRAYTHLTQAVHEQRKAGRIALADALEYVAAKDAHAGYTQAQDVLKCAAQFGHFTIESYPAPAEEATPPDDWEWPQAHWDALDRETVGVNGALPAAASAVNLWVHQPMFILTRHDTISPTVNSFLARLHPVEPSRARFGHLRSANMSGHLHGLYEPSVSVAYFEDPLAPDVLVTTLRDTRGATRTVIPSRMSMFRDIPGVMDDAAMLDLTVPDCPMVVTPEGIAHPFPTVSWSGYNVGYHGGAGPMALAAALRRVYVGGGGLSDDAMAHSPDWLQGSFLESSECPKRVSVGAVREALLVGASTVG